MTMRRKSKHHEKSITVERGGKYFVLDNSGKNKGAKLGAQKGYATMKAANAYAKKRSIAHGKNAQAQKRTAKNNTKTRKGAR